MKNTIQNIEDLLTDPFFRSWVNNPTPELDRFWQLWLVENQDKAYLFDQAKDIIKSIEFKEYEASAKKKSNLFNEIRVDSYSYKKNRSIAVYIYRIAAAILISIGIGFYLQSSEEEYKKENEITVKSNKSGEQSRIILPDSTLVELNASSSITYSTSFDGEFREVFLEGEAFFDVRSNRSRPFRVISNSLEILVLGTEFNVISYDSVFEVSLVEGSVHLSSKNGQQSFLRPGEKASYDFVTGVFVSTTFEPDIELGWKEGRLVFNADSYHEVIRKLQNWYGIEISAKIPKEFDDWSYTGSFKNETIDNVLMNMRTLRHFEYSFKSDTLFISFE